MNPHGFPHTPLKRARLPDSAIPAIRESLVCRSVHPLYGAPFISVNQTEGLLAGRQEDAGSSNLWYAEVYPAWSIF